MKKFISICLSICLFLGIAKSQNIDSKYGVDSAQTIINTSIYTEYFKHKNYKEALPAWRYVYNNAPKFQLSTYTRGATMMTDMYVKTKNEAYVDTLMQVYDQWIKYFGNDARYGKGYALGKKGADLYRLRQNNIEAAKESYSYLVEAFDIAQAKSHPLTVRITFLVAEELLKNNDISRDEFINLYSKLSNYAKNGITSAKNPEPYQETSNTIDAIFFNAGVADCETLSKLLTERFNKSSDDINELNSIIRILRRGECSELPLYATVAEAIYRAEPTADAAYSLAIMFLQKKEYDKTEAYLKEAIEKGEDSEEKADYYWRYAQIKLAQKRYAEAQKNAQQAIRLNPNLGQAYITIGQAYAAYSKEYSDDDFDQAAVFWVAVDKFIKAKQVDPSLTGSANEYINVYSPHFPSKDEAFFRGIKEGDTYKVGSWINETTKVRFR